MYVACDSGDTTEGLGGGNSYAATYPIQRSIGTQIGPSLVKDSRKAKDLRKGGTGGHVRGGVHSRPR